MAKKPRQEHDVFSPSTKTINRTFTYPAFLSPANEMLAIRYMDRIRTLYERAALEPTLDAAKAVVRMQGADLWWPNRNHLEAMLFAMAVRKERFRPGMAPMPLKADATRGTITGSVVGTVRYRDEIRSPLEAMFKGRTLRVDREPKGEWHGHPIHSVTLPITAGPKNEQEVLEFDFALTRLPPEDAYLFRLVLTGSNLNCPPPDGEDSWPVLRNDTKYYPPAPRFRLGLVLTYPVVRDPALPSHTGILRPSIFRDGDGDIHLGQFEVPETGEKTTFRLPSEYVHRAVRVAQEPLAFRRRARFLRWRGTEYHRMALHIWRSCKTLVIEPEPSNKMVVPVQEPPETPRGRRLNVHVDDLLAEILRTSEALGGSVTRRRSLA